jgi:hypothetical protein
MQMRMTRNIGAVKGYAGGVARAASGGQAPVKRGGRFSRKARMPS